MRTCAHVPVQVQEAKELLAAQSKSSDAASEQDPVTGVLFYSYEDEDEGDDDAVWPHHHDTQQDSDSGMGGFCDSSMGMSCQ